MPACCDGIPSTKVFDEGGAYAEGEPIDERETEARCTKRPINRSFSTLISASRCLIFSSSSAQNEN